MAAQTFLRWPMCPSVLPIQSLATASVYTTQDVYLEILTEVRPRQIFSDS